MTAPINSKIDENNIENNNKKQTQNIEKSNLQKNILEKSNSAQNIFEQKNNKDKIESSNDKNNESKKKIVNESSVAVEKTAISHWIWKHFKQSNQNNPVKMGFIAQCNNQLKSNEKITSIEAKPGNENTAQSTNMGELIIKTQNHEYPIIIGKNSIEVMGKVNMIPAVFVVIAMAAKKQIEDAIDLAVDDPEQKKLAENKKLVTITSSGITDEQLIEVGSAILDQGLIPNFSEQKDENMRTQFIKTFLAKLLPAKIDLLNKEILAYEARNPSEKKDAFSFPDQALKQAVTAHIQAKKDLSQNIDIPDSESKNKEVNPELKDGLPKL
ncbi:MAG: hypothetical protein HKM04_11675 [Legionellales bacterium]|nr:hypothetical protein [Legionellales bacterium]